MRICGVFPLALGGLVEGNGVAGGRAGQQIQRMGAQSGRSAATLVRLGSVRSAHENAVVGGAVLLDADHFVYHTHRQRTVTFYRKLIALRTVRALSKIPHM